MLWSSFLRKAGSFYNKLWKEISSHELIISRHDANEAKL